MRSKLMLLLAIARGADLLILDEPMEGLDPAASEDVLAALTALAAAEGTTIFFSSHQIADVEQIADHVCIVDKGRAMVSGALDDLKATYQRLHVVFEHEAPDRVSMGGRRRARCGRRGECSPSWPAGTSKPCCNRFDRFPGASVERFPVTLKEIFLEHVRSH